MQLRAENKERTLYNIVGFQTNLKWGEQKRVFSMIPGLENAEFVRYGVMHRNTFLDAPRVLSAQLCLKAHPNVFFAGRSPVLRAIWKAPPAVCWRHAISTPAWRANSCPRRPPIPCAAR